MLRATPAILTQTGFFQAVNQYIFGRKHPFAFPPKDWALLHVDCFHVEVKKLCLHVDQ